jgi:superfamily II DNA or RNA helicase
VNVSHSLRTVRQYIERNIPAAHLDATTPDFIRKEIIADFKQGKYKVICNVGIITEGFDFPNLDFVQLARPTKSLSMYLQMVGRVTRPCISVDKWAEKELRKYYIKQSSKPYGIVLDNAGCWLDHNLPEMDHDWELHFKGARKAKKVDGEFEMLVFVAEGPSGIIRTTNPNEIEGLRLKEITKEEKKAYINLNCLKDFDKTYYTFCNLRSMKAPGYTAITDFIKQCEHSSTLMVPEVWQHIHKRTVDDIQAKQDDLTIKRAKSWHSYPDNVFQEALKKIERGRVSRQWLGEVRQKYENKHANQLKKYHAGKAGGSGVTATAR